MGYGDGLGDITWENVTREVTRKGRGIYFGDGDSGVGDVEKVVDKWGKGGKRLVGKGVEKLGGKMEGLERVF